MNISQILWFIGILVVNFLRASEYSGDYIEFSEHEVCVTKRLGDLSLYKDRDGFHIIKNGEICDIQYCFCDQMLRSMSDEQLKTFLGRNNPQIIMISPEELDHIDKNNIIEITGDEKNDLMGKLFGSGYIVVNQMSNGEYSLHAKVRLPGGGIWSELWSSQKVNIFAAIGKAVCIIIVAAAGALVGAWVGAGAAFLFGTSLAKGAAAGAIAGALIGAYNGCPGETNTGDPGQPNTTETPVNTPLPTRADRGTPLCEIPPIHNPFREPGANGN
jgi:hypothetical protein